MNSVEYSFWKLLDLSLHSCTLITRPSPRAPNPIQTSVSTDFPIPLSLSLTQRNHSSTSPEPHLTTAESTAAAVSKLLLSSFSCEIFRWGSRRCRHVQGRVQLQHLQLWRCCLLGRSLPAGGWFFWLVSALCCSSSLCS